MKDPKKVKMGKKSKAAGAAFELRVRKDLESEGWIVDKWSNNVDLDKSKIVPAKHKFRGIGIPMAMGTGFPDFLCFYWGVDGGPDYADVIGVEVKTNGYLDKIEREKCRWYLDNCIFSKILIAEKIKEGNKVKIIYHDFEKKYGN